MKRFCEVSTELREPVMAAGLSQRDGHTYVRQWASLGRCPRDGGHCGAGEKCLAMEDGQVRQRIERLKDRLFQIGFIHEEEKKHVR